MNTPKTDENPRPPLADTPGSEEADPLIIEMRSLATTKYPLYSEARLMLEMAVEAQQGKPIDMTRLIPNKD